MSLLRIVLVSLLVQNAAPSRPAASIEGVVVRAGTDEPVSGAVVLLRKAPGAIGLGKRIEATSRDDGKFVFPNLEAGSYRASITHPDGYHVLSRSDPRVGFNESPIQLTAGQQFSGVRFEMTPIGVIAGRVLDQKNKPMSRVRVWAIRPSYYEGLLGLRVASGMYEAGTPDSTDEKGEYRLTRLSPGLYRVAATARVPLLLPGMDSCTPNSPQFVGGIVGAVMAQGASMVPDLIYSPGTPFPEMASSLSVREGERSEADIRVVPSPALQKVRGEVVDVQGERVRSASVTLVPRGRVFTDVGFCNVNAGKGSFQIINAAPGSYYLLATANVSGVELAGRTPIDIDTAALKDIKIVVKPRLEVSGRITFADSVGGSLPGIKVELVPQLPLEFPSEGSAQQKSWAISSTSSLSDGSFVVRGALPWEYRPTVFGVAPSVYIKSARLGIRDLLIEGLSTDNITPGGIEIVLDSNGGTIEASVFHPNRQPAPGIIAALIPDKDRQRADLYKAAVADDSGRLQFQNIAPGDYKIYVWDRVPHGAWRDPDFMRLYEDRGKPVDVGPGSRAIVELSLP